MRLKTLLLAIFATGGLLFGVFAVTNVFAQENERGITVSPLIFELSANPGDDLTHDLRVDNPTDTALSLAVDVRNFVAVGEEGQPGLTDEDTTFSLAKWVTANPSEFTIPAKGSQSIKFTINTPANAEPGGHFGSIVIKTKPSPGGGQVAIAQEVGSLVLLKVAGQLVEQAGVESFDATPDFSERGPINFNLRLKNSGNVHYKPISSVTITDMFGREVGKAQFDSRNVLPDSVRKFDTQWKPGLLFGRYTATATIVYGSTNQVIQATTTFWGFPITYGLIIGIPIIILLVLAVLARDRLKRAFKVLFGKSSAAEPPHRPNDSAKFQKDKDNDHHHRKL